MRDAASGAPRPATRRRSRGAGVAPPAPAAPASRRRRACRPMPARAAGSPPAPSHGRATRRRRATAAAGAADAAPSRRAAPPATPRDAAAARRTLGRAGAPHGRAPAASPRWCASWRCRPSASASSKARASRVWRLRVERETLRTPALREKLQAALADGLAQPVRLEVEAGAATDTPAERAAEARAPPGARPNRSSTTTRWCRP